MPTDSKLKQICCTQFQEQYHRTPERCFFSPGRINIIGEHIDYNGGLVFPCAISRGTVAAVSQRSDRKLRLYSHNFPDFAVREFSLEPATIQFREEQQWTNYVLGMLAVLAQEGIQLERGLDIAFYGNLPTGGSGLSSSASIEVLMGYIISQYAASSLSRKRLALLAQQAENEFCGMHCGIMDQFIIAAAEAEKACLLNCASLEYEQVPLSLQSSGYAFLIANTKLPRKLQESRYNERRRECEQALAVLQQAGAPWNSKADLCSIQAEELTTALEILRKHDSGSVLEKRTRHVVSENLRTQKAAAAMKSGQWQKLGQLLSESHHSLRYDYQVSGEHLDYLVELLEAASQISSKPSVPAVPTVLGARMTGAGFGGCAIALIKLEEQLEENEIIEWLSRSCSPAYRKRFGWEPEFYLSEAVSGVCELPQKKSRQES